MMRIFSAIYNDTLNIIMMIFLVLLLRQYFKNKSYEYVMCLWIFTIIRFICIFEIYLPIQLPLINNINYEISTSFSQMIPNTNYTYMYLIIKVIYYIWFIGFICLTYKTIKQYNQFKKNIENSIRIDKDTYECNEIETSFVLGVIKPKIYLPTNITNETKEIMIKHEKIHIQQYHHVIKTIIHILLLIYWMNPIVWIAYNLINQDIECACDEIMIKEMDDFHKKEYAQMLFKYSISKEEQLICTFSSKDLKERILNIMSNKKITWISKQFIYFSLLFLFIFNIKFESNQPKQLIYDHYEQLYINGLLDTSVEYFQMIDIEENEKIYSIKYVAYDKYNKPSTTGYSNLRLEKENEQWNIIEVK